MEYAEGFLSEDALATLTADVLRAYDPRTNAIDLSTSSVVEDVRLLLEPIARCELRYFGAFLLLISETTIETAARNSSEGWHVDSSCALVEGACFNAWIPLYNSSTNSGIQVITQRDNPDIYAYLGDATLPLKVLVKSSAPEVFAQVSASDMDLILLREGTPRSLVLHWDDVVVSSRGNPRAGDLALFKQTEIHRGFHDDGIRIQLSIKFCEVSARQIQGRSGRELEPKSLTKHGRLEAQLIRELLNPRCSAGPDTGRGGVGAAGDASPPHH